jgi:hypothetical protein
MSYPQSRTATGFQQGYVSHDSTAQVCKNRSCFYRPGRGRASLLSLHDLGMGVRVSPRVALTRSRTSLWWVLFAA